MRLSGDLGEEGKLIHRANDPIKVSPKRVVQRFKCKPASSFIEQWMLTITSWCAHAPCTTSYTTSSITYHEMILLIDLDYLFIILSCLPQQFHSNIHSVVFGSSPGCTANLRIIPLPEVILLTLFNPSVNNPCSIYSESVMILLHFLVNFYNQLHVLCGHANDKLPDSNLATHPPITLVRCIWSGWHLCVLSLKRLILGPNRT